MQKQAGSNRWPLPPLMLSIAYRLKMNPLSRLMAQRAEQTARARDARRVQSVEITPADLQRENMPFR